MNKFPRQGESLQRLKTKHPTQDDLARKLWLCLQQFEPALQQPPSPSVGHSRGDRLDVQWWLDESGQFFAMQAVDKLHAHQWELFHIPLQSGQALAGRRSNWQRPAGGHPADDHGTDILERIWQEVFVPELDGAHDARHPSFMDLVAAGLTPSGVASVRDDSAVIANLRADVDYWSQLARTLAKNGKSDSTQPVLRRAAHTVATQDEGVGDSQTPSWKLRDLNRWAAENADRIVILPRAISAAKRSHYQDDDFVFECLNLLANEYTLVKTGRADRNDFRVKADAMGLAYGGSVDPSVAGMWAEDYFVRWNGRRRFLDQHITKGNSRDVRFCLRIYFTWDDDSQRVIVGWLPSHLGTSGT